jgi:hypothetical protein
MAVDNDSYHSSDEAVIYNGSNPGMNDGNLEVTADDFGGREDDSSADEDCSSGDDTVEVTDVKRAPFSRPPKDYSDTESYDDSDLYSKPRQEVTIRRSPRKNGGTPVAPVLMEFDEVEDVCTPVAAAAAPDFAWIDAEETNKKINIFEDSRFLVFKKLHSVTNTMGWECGYCGSTWSGGANASKALAHIAK